MQTPSASSRTGLLRAGLLEAILWVVPPILVFFWPFLLQGRHIVPFHFEQGCVTGIPGGGDPLALGTEKRWPDCSAITYHYPWAHFVGEALRRGELPTWNPYVGCGTPGLGGGQIFPFSPFLWPFYLFSNPWIYTLGLLLGCLWGAWGFYLWLGRFGLTPWQRGLGVALAAINPWTVRMIVYSSVWAGWWFGWLMWAWDLAASDKGERRWWLPGVMVAGMVYCGHPETSLLIAAVSAGYAWVTWLLKPKEQRAPAFWFRFIGSVGIAGALTAIHWLPVVRNLEDSLPYKLIMPHLSTQGHYLAGNLLNPNTDAYVSPVVAGLVLVGAWTVLRQHQQLALLTVPILSVVFLFQPIPSNLLKGLVTFGGILPPFYGTATLWLGLVPLVAVGTARMGSKQRPRSLVWLALLGGAGFYVLGFGLNAVLGGDLASHLRPGWLLFYGAVFLGLALGRMDLPLWGKAIFCVALVALCLDPFVLGYGRLKQETPYGFVSDTSEPRFSYFNDRDPGHSGPPAPRELKELPGGAHGRFWAPFPTPSAHLPCLTPDLSIMWGTRDIRIQDVMLNRRYCVLHESFQMKGKPRFWNVLTFPKARMGDLGLLGVRYVGFPGDLRSGQFRWIDVPEALPRAFLAHRLVPAKDEEDSFRLWNLLLSEGRLRQEVIVEGWAGPAQAGAPDAADRTAWLEDGFSRIRLETSARDEAVLVLLDTYAEGWKVDVDGKAARLYPANLAFRAVALPAGTHEVRFEYRPAAVRTGALLTVMGFVATAALWVLGLLRRRRETLVP